MVSWTSCLHSGCAAVVSVGQKGLTLSESRFLHPLSVTKTCCKDMRETVYLFTMCKDNNSGLMHQELKFLWMNSYRLTRNICCGSDSVWDALHAEQLQLLIVNAEKIHDSCFQARLYMNASKKADSCATLGMWHHFHQPKLIDVTCNCWKEMT